LSEGRALTQFRGNPAATPAEILRICNELGTELPKDYLAFLQRKNGGDGFIGTAYVIFWRADELLPNNRAYEVATYAPGFFAFGTNGGGEAFAFDLRAKIGPVVALPFIGMESSAALPIALTFELFLVALAEGQWPA
jgi:hypothetical protein